MADFIVLARKVEWYQDPLIYFNFSYQKMRSGTTQQYIIKVECEPLTGASYFGYPIYVDITVNGEKKTTTLKDASPSQWRSYLSYTTETISVENKTIGTVPLDIRIYSGSGSVRDMTKYYNLPIDPAPSTITATDARIESTSLITFTRYGNSLTHSLSYRPEGYEGFTGNEKYTSIFVKQNIVSYGWTVDKSLFAYIPNEKAVKVRFKCETYDGPNLVGTNYCTMYATTSEYIHAPSVSIITAEDVNPNTIALTGNNKKIIKFHSDVKVAAEASSKYKATISRINFWCGSQHYEGTSCTFEDVETADVRVIATDSRGYVTTKYGLGQGLTLVEYVKLTANSIATRTNPTGDEVTFTTKGNYFNNTFGAVNNTLTVQIAYKLHEAETFSSYADMDVEIDGNTYTATATIKGFDYLQNYDISIRAQDKIYKAGGALADAIYNNFVLQKGIPVFDWGENDFKFNVPVIFADGSKAYFEAGDTVTTSSIFAGYFYGEGKRLKFTIPLSKPIIADTISMSGTLYGYDAKGYIFSRLDLTGDDVAAILTEKSICGIEVQILFTKNITNIATDYASAICSGTVTLTFA